jgi:hypothetical protein
MKETCPHNNETDASIQQCNQAVIEFHSNETVVYGLLMKLCEWSENESRLDAIRGATDWREEHVSLYSGR